LGTEHTEFRLTPAEAHAVIPELPRIWDEPFADESQIPTFLLAQLARQDVTVALSGDGGDECFGGYARHFMSARLAPIFTLPLRLRRMAASALLLIPRTGEKLIGTLPFPAYLRFNNENLQKFARILGVADDREFYEALTTFVRRTVAIEPGISEEDKVPSLPDAVSRIIYRDMAGYLPSDILVKLDRATMATSLEARCPFLDHRIIEFVWRLPTAVKVRGGQGKWLLRRVLGRYLPDDLFERPKQGFNVPIGAWLIGPLRDWAQALLDPARIRRDGLLNPAQVQACWREHLSGRRDRARELWAILMVQAWLDAMRNPSLHAASTGALEAAIATTALPVQKMRDNRAYG
jgi:asparagine synthase (glutamine-hydrolysing)